VASVSGAASVVGATVVWGVSSTGSGFT